MRRPLARSALLLTIASPIFAIAAPAQTPTPVAANAAMQGPPPVLRIDREQIKPGKGAAHAKFEAGWPAAFAKAGNQTGYLAYTAVTGASEAWFLIGYPSFDAMVKDDKSVAANKALSADLDRLSTGDGDFVAGSDELLAVNLAKLSNGVPVDMSKMHYMEIVTYRMRPGHDGDFSKMAGMIKDAYTKGNVQQPWTIYRVISGAPDGTYLVMLPMRTLAELDDAPNINAAIGTALGAEGASALNKMESDGITTSTSRIFAVNPKMSYVNAQFKAGDPAFWH